MGQLWDLTVNYNVVIGDQSTVNGLNPQRPSSSLAEHEAFVGVAGGQAVLLLVLGSPVRGCDVDVASKIFPSCFYNSFCH